MNRSLDFTSAVKTTADDKDFSSEDVTEEAPKKEEQKPSTTVQKPDLMRRFLRNFAWYKFHLLIYFFHPLLPYDLQMQNRPDSII